MSPRNIALFAISTLLAVRAFLGLVAFLNMLKGGHP